MYPKDHNLYLLEALFVMSILSTVSLWMLISHVVITVVSLIIDGVLVSSDKTTITGVAVEQSWLSLLYHDVVSNTNHYGGFTFLYLRT